MRDQAARLRQTQLQDDAVDALELGPRVMVVGSGKGGVGKSILSVLISGELALRGNRVLLVDGAQNLGNLHVLLGVKPAGHLEALLSGDVRAAQLVQPVVANLWLLPGDSGAAELHALSPVDRARVHHRLSLLYDDYDTVIIDGGAGIESVVRVSTMRATSLTVVAASEPTALTDAYALMKIVTMQLPRLPIGVIANRVADEAEGRAAFERLALAADHFLSRTITHLGTIPEDPGMRDMVRAPERLLQEREDSTTHEAVARLVAEGLAPFTTAPTATTRHEETPCPAQ